MRLSGQSLVFWKKPFTNIIKAFAGEWLKPLTSSHLTDTAVVSKSSKNIGLFHFMKLSGLGLWKVGGSICPACARTVSNLKNP
jgi:hypothetical protein